MLPRGCGAVVQVGSGLPRNSAAIGLLRRQARGPGFTESARCKLLHEGGKVAVTKLVLMTTRRFFTRALEHCLRPTEVTTDRAAAYARVLDELLPAACHVLEQSWPAQGQIGPDARTETAALRPCH